VFYVKLFIVYSKSNLTIIALVFYRTFNSNGYVPEAPLLTPVALSSLSEDEVQWMKTWIGAISLQSEK